MIRVSDAFGETEKWQRRAGAIAVLTAVTASGTFFSTAVAAPSDGDFRTAAVNAIHDRYLVVLKGESAGLAERKSNARKLLESYADAQLDYVYQSTVNGFSVQMPEEAARRLATDPAVDYVQQDASVTVTGDTLSSRPATQAVEDQASWNMDRIDQRTWPLDGKFNANNPTGPNSGSGTRIYVTDTGVNSTHKTFGNRVKFGIDTTADPSLGYAPGQDCNGHGTAAASVAAGAAYTQDSGDVTHGYGIARGADIVNVKWGNCAANTSHTRQLAGLDWIHNDSLRLYTRSAVSISYGIPDFPLIHNALNQIATSGTTVVIAAGNDSADVCGPLANPTYTNPNLIIVGASDENDNRADFSSYGKCLALWAPGVNIPAAAHNQNDASTDFAGTSAAAPAVAGAAAVIMYGLPDAAAVKARLRFEASENQMHNIPDTPAYLLHVGGRYQDTTAVNLVDGGAVTSTPITVSDQADPKARNYLKVRVNITHHTRGDLALDLIAPDGSVYRFKSPSPDTGDDINQEYDVDASSEAPNGQWRVRVTDTKSDTQAFDGRLIDWGLQF